MNLPPFNKRKLKLNENFFILFRVCTSLVRVEGVICKGGRTNYYVRDFLTEKLSLKFQYYSFQIFQYHDKFIYQSTKERT